MAILNDAIILGVPDRYHDVAVSLSGADSPLRKAVQGRILNEMLGSIKDTTGGGWKVLILDDVTTRCVAVQHLAPR